VKDDITIDMDNQPEKAFRIAYLVAGFIKENLTEAEHSELDDWVNENMDNQRRFEKWIDPDNIEAWRHYRDKLDMEMKYQHLKSRIDIHGRKQKSKIKSLVPWLVAAVLLPAILIPYYLLRNKDADIVTPIIAKDIAPATNRATLTLSDNSVVVLDSMHEKNITRQGNTNVLKQDTEMIVYKPTGLTAVPGTIEYNTLTTPAGGKFKVLLPDGSLVWLNAVSSLKYPVAFGGNERRVELTGEGYFEVAKDAAHPFIVKANNNTVKVLGTHFNINAYTDEPMLKVTLAEGSVKVNDSKVIKPGQQAQVNYPASGIEPGWSYRVIENADMEAEMAWQKGMFVFKGTDLEDIMRQVSRWYDADIEYNFRPVLHLNAEISRNTPVSKLLHLLEGPDRVHFKIENKKITVVK
jgi:ferric-dicitrate binding protein FerR (iron transport regulator)